ncbi:hypothetical protein ACFVU3_26825 [Streptomyces sp. NPDC058052]|uniref:competence protein CoiA family protein n=1 Tax=Streptomyces sp. NPDC058052 TaxID=3346316 RepID=UPI0036EB5011
MAHSVFHRELGRLNLSELDLTVSEDLRLWRSVYRRTVKGDLECGECREADPGCPQYMFLRLWKGRPVAVHYSQGRRHATAPESPRHKALKERIAAAAERAGFTAELETRGPDGRRRTDVLVHGEGDIELGCEVQLSCTTSHSVARRSDLARADGLRPLWTTEDPSSPLIERTPWARIDRMPLEAYSSGNALLVRGGVRELKLARCDARGPVPCPDRGHGRCNHWHGTWAPALGMHLDRLIGVTAAGEYVPLYLPVQRGRRSRAAHMRVSADDHGRYLDATTDTLAQPEPGHADDSDPAAPERLPFDGSCSYQARRGEDRRRDIVRDTDALMPAGIALSDPRPGFHPARERTCRPGPTAGAPAGGSTPAGVSPTPASIPLQPGPRDRDVSRQPIVGDGSPDCPADLVGPCAVCRMPTHRYGIGGSPLCPLCRLDRSLSA